MRAAKIEKLFAKYDTDRSGQIDKVEFRKACVLRGALRAARARLACALAVDDIVAQCWLSVCDVHNELNMRGMPTTKWQLRSTLERRLEKFILAEEEAELKSLTLADQWQAWRAEMADCAAAADKWRIRGDIELTAALDTAGQVYMFGGGTHGQFAQGEPRLEHVPNGDRLLSLWEKRLRPHGLQKVQAVRAARRTASAAPAGAAAAAAAAGADKPAGGGPVAAAARPGGVADEDEAAYQALLKGTRSPRAPPRCPSAARAMYSNAPPPRAASAGTSAEREHPFARLNACVNTVMLWGQRVTRIAIADSTAFALTEPGQIFAWGGTSEWWTAEREVSATKAPAYNPGNVTERSRLVLGYGQQESAAAAAAAGPSGGQFSWTPVAAETVMPPPSPDAPTALERKRRHRKNRPVVPALVANPDALQPPVSVSEGVAAATAKEGLAPLEVPAAGAGVPRRPGRIVPLLRKLPLPPTAAAAAPGGPAAAASARSDTENARPAGDGAAGGAQLPSPSSSRQRASSGSSRAPGGDGSVLRKLSRVLESPLASVRSALGSRADEAPPTGKELGRTAATGAVAPQPEAEVFVTEVRGASPWACANNAGVRTICSSRAGASLRSTSGWVHRAPRTAPRGGCVRSAVRAAQGQVA